MWADQWCVPQAVKWLVFMEDNATEMILVAAASNV